MIHKSCYSSNIIHLFCKHCDRHIEAQDIINIDTPFWDSISIIKNSKKQPQIAEMIINAIGKIK